MLDDTTPPNTNQDAPNLCDFDAIAQEPHVVEMPDFVDSSHGLDKSLVLDKSLDNSLTCPSTAEDFELKFPVAPSLLSTFVSSTNKLYILPEQIDFSELLSFPSDKNPNEEQLVQQVVAEDQKDTDSSCIHKMQEISEELKDIASDAILPQLKPPQLNTTGIFSRFFSNQYEWEPSMKNFFQDAKRNGLKSPDYIKSRLLMGFIKEFMNEFQSDKQSTSSETASSSESLNSYMRLFSTSTKPSDWPSPKPDNSYKGLEKSIINLEDKVDEADSGVETNISNKSDSLSDDPIPTSENLEVIDDEIHNDSAESQANDEQQMEIEEIKSSHEINNVEVELTQLPEVSNAVTHTNKIVLATAEDIQKNGAKIFRKPTKLFIFDCLKQWKKLGEGQIEIWKHSDSGKCYILLWDKSTRKLLLNMRLDGKLSINYLANSTNSCRWSHFNYANCPEGVLERLACRFKDSEIAAQFKNIVAKNMANTRFN